MDSYIFVSNLYVSHVGQKASVQLNFCLFVDMDCSCDVSAQTKTRKHKVSGHFSTTAKWTAPSLSAANVCCMNLSSYNQEGDILFTLHLSTTVCLAKIRFTLPLCPISHREEGNNGLLDASLEALSRAFQSHQLTVAGFSERRVHPL